MASNQPLTFLGWLGMVIAGLAWLLWICPSGLSALSFVIHDASDRRHLIESYDDLVLFPTIIGVATIAAVQARWPGRYQITMACLVAASALWLRLSLDFP